MEGPVMPNPTTAAEWAEKCNQDYLTSMRVEGRSNGHLRHGVCLNCADAYARQQVEAARLDWSCPLCHCCREKRHDGGDPCVSCALSVEAFREHLLRIAQEQESAGVNHMRYIIAALRAL